MTTNFERLFPLLTLQSCVSFATGSHNGPRFEASDCTNTQSPLTSYEVRVIRLHRTEKRFHDEGSRQPELTLRDATAQRAAVLLAAAAQVRGSSGKPSKAFPFLFPEDMYIAQDEPPSISAEGNGQHQVARSPRGGIPRCHVVMVYTRCGSSLFDLLQQAKKGVAVSISRQSFEALCQLAGLYAKTHLTFPAHGNLSLNSFLLRSPDKDEEEWVLSDWSGQEPEDSRKAQSEEEQQQHSFGQTKKVHLKLLRIFQTTFAPNRVQDDRAVRKRSDPAVVGVRRGHRLNELVLPQDEVEALIVDTICGARQPHDSPQRQIEDQLGRVESAVRDVQGGLDVADPLTASPRAASSVEGGTSTSLCSEEEESAHVALLAMDRVHAALEARSSEPADLPGTATESASNNNSNAAEDAAHNVAQQSHGRGIPLLSADVLHQLVICRQRLLQRTAHRITVLSETNCVDDAITTESSLANVRPSSSVYSNVHTNEVEHYYVPPFHASAEYQSVAGSSRTCIAPVDEPQRSGAAPASTSSKASQASSDKSCCLVM